MGSFETVVDCSDLDANVRFFVDELGWRISMVTPADDPAEYVVEHPDDGGRVRLRRSNADIPVVLRSSAVRSERVVAPNGTVLERVATPTTVGAAMDVPEAVPSVTVVTGEEGGFGVGRAGMTYRDLLPDRWGGRFIASHIRVDHDRDEGAIADWVHFHRIRFQMIFVAAGWVDVVYEDQGEPFRMHVGDCVLQPPEIRHRVLRSSTGLEVIEIGCPAEHDTIADHDLALPNDVVRPDRDFDGQVFVRHVAADAPWTPWIDERTEVRCRDTGIGAATDGLAGAVVVRPHGAASSFGHDGEFVLLVGLGGRAEISVGDERVGLDPRGAISVPPGVDWRWETADEEHEALVVTLPATAVAVR